MYSENANVVNFTIIDLLIEEKIKVKVSFLNFAPKWPHVASRISKCIFHILATFAKLNFLKLGMLRSMAPTEDNAFHFYWLGNT